MVISSTEKNKQYHQTKQNKTQIQILLKPISTGNDYQYYFGGFWGSEHLLIW